MSAILNFDLKKNAFSEENYLNYTHKKKKTTIWHVTLTFSLKQEETRASVGPIWMPLIDQIVIKSSSHPSVHGANVLYICVRKKKKEEKTKTKTKKQKNLHLIKIKIEVKVLLPSHPYPSLCFTTLCYYFNLISYQGVFPR